MTPASINNIVESRLAWKLNVRSAFGNTSAYFEASQEDRYPKDVGLPKHQRQEACKEDPGLLFCQIAPICVEYRDHG